MTRAFTDPEDSGRGSYACAERRLATKQPESQTNIETMLEAEITESEDHW